jgi:hypothetical protein
MNTFVRDHLKTLEMAGVLVRIASFSFVSWLGYEVASNWRTENWVNHVT